MNERKPAQYQATQEPTGVIRKSGKNAGKKVKSTRKVPEFMDKNWKSKVNKEYK